MALRILTLENYILSVSLHDDLGNLELILSQTRHLPSCIYAECSTWCTVHKWTTIYFIYVSSEPTWHAIRHPCHHALCTHTHVGYLKL
ncbi:hypothetical protein COCSUDRAFT_33059 [Coccomyxa subellipsoidea C-169]|uniref:Uncharacterized protein n=1 Tax=Coccomyxa subellipsoidea (strain C-169) TaxID=574566 RepID=I0YYA8_COCSC|nr:hypothetical protein COCSUDRAFT_33059 [Coccomyxa subellipsoidea C-169]EIE23377.1 hypothetical protein COCSUDRAFT_33059 [Coccomyxa subellipsoidea C-169]|eukprot:XP_005647921.1 hypothetical protein COCSUDRAFT_33059 [Coccomyxa subellipsoidea C-169]